MSPAKEPPGLPEPGGEEPGAHARVAPGAACGEGGKAAAAEGKEAAAAEVISLEQGLVRRAQTGDRRALQRLLTLHADALYSRVILPRAGDPTVAQDMLKATMVTAIEKLDTFRWQERSIYHWLRRIAVNKVIDHHRGRQRLSRLCQLLAEEPEPEVLPSRIPGPEEALIAAQEARINRQRVTETLKAINPRYRQAIELRLMEELPREQCARQMEVTVGTFDVVVFRALRAFRRAFLGEA